jgi:hypothetical protein
MFRMDYVYDDEFPHPHFPFSVRVQDHPVIRRLNPEYTTAPASLQYLQTQPIEFYPQACITTDDDGMVEIVIEPHHATVSEGFTIMNRDMSFSIFDEEGDLLLSEDTHQPIYLTLPPKPLYIYCQTHGHKYCLLQMFESSVEEAKVAIDMFYRYSMSGVMCYKVMCSLIGCFC